MKVKTETKQHTGSHAKLIPAVIFPDGSRLEADTWVELEVKLREDMWNPREGLKFRKEFRNRAHNWSGTAIPVESSSREFFRDLERAGLVLIEREWTA